MILRRRTLFVAQGGVCFPNRFAVFTASTRFSCFCLRSPVCSHLAHHPTRRYLRVGEFTLSGFTFKKFSQSRMRVNGGVMLTLPDICIDSKKPDRFLEYFVHYVSYRRKWYRKMESKKAKVGLFYSRFYNVCTTYAIVNSYRNLCICNRIGIDPKMKKTPAMLAKEARHLKWLVSLCSSYGS